MSLPHTHFLNVGCQNQNNQLKDAKIFCKAEAKWWYFSTHFNEPVCLNTIINEAYSQ